MRFFEFECQNTSALHKEPVLTEFAERPTDPSYRVTRKRACVLVFIGLWDFIFRMCVSL